MSSEFSDCEFVVVVFKRTGVVGVRCREHARGRTLLEDVCAKRLIRAFEDYDSPFGRTLMRAARLDVGHMELTASDRRKGGR